MVTSAELELGWKEMCKASPCDNRASLHLFVGLETRLQHCRGW